MGQKIQYLYHKESWKKSLKKNSGHPGQGENLDLAGPCFPENVSALLDRSSGCKDIVDEENFFFLHGFLFLHNEGPAYVLPPFGPGQLGLGVGLSGPLEGRKVDRNRPTPAHLAGQK